MNAILVSVDYADILALTLPYNRHHFERVVVVTSPKDGATFDVATRCNAEPFVTGAFYDDGANFNKWKALEQGLDYLGRRGWLCVMDADVLWPKQVQVTDESDLNIMLSCYCNSTSYFGSGHLLTPLRRMCERLHVPPESSWSMYPLHPQQHEWAGYTQIFHGSDPVLGQPPWHQTDWRHAGGADSFFQAKWSRHLKLRPPFEVLHLGPTGVNWCGRASTYADGTVPEGAAERVQRVRQFIRGRVPGPDRFRNERL